jgi:hypothetical protein
MVAMNTASGSATLAYQVDRQAGVITITQRDISYTSTLTTVRSVLMANVP